MVKDSKIEKTIWSLCRDGLTENTLKIVSDYLLKQFIYEQKIEYRLEKKLFFPHEYSSYFFVCEYNNFEPFSIQLKANLIVKVHDKKLYIYVIATGYSNNLRIGLQSHEGESILSFEYVQSDNGCGKWSHGTWEADESGEYQSYSELK